MNLFAPEIVIVEDSREAFLLHIFRFYGKISYIETCPYHRFHVLTNMKNLLLMNLKTLQEYSRFIRILCINSDINSSLFAPEVFITQDRNILSSLYHIDYMGKSAAKEANIIVCRGFNIFRIVYCYLRSSRAFHLPLVSSRPDTLVCLMPLADCFYLKL